MACFAKQFGPNDNQLHGYPGHPELELAVLRLYALTRDPQHLAFGEYLLSARGVQRDDQKGKSYFPFEAMQREDPLYSMNLPNTEDMRWVIFSLTHTDGVLISDTTNPISPFTSKTQSKAIRCEHSTS